jgi:hypothetical protein
LTDQQRRFLTGPLAPLAVLIISLFLSLIFYVIFRPRLDGRVFFYPDNAGERIAAERRAVPRRSDTASRMEVFLDELALGPIRLEFSKTMPAGTDILHVAVLEKTAYVNLDKTMLKASNQLAVDFDEALENIRYNILFNFSRIEDVVFTIDGNQVHAPFYRAPDSPD